MRYVMMVYNPETAEDAAPPTQEETAVAYAAFAAFHKAALENENARMRCDR